MNSPPTDAIAAPALTAVARIASVALAAERVEQVCDALADGILATLGCEQVHVVRISADGSCAEGFVHFADESPAEPLLHQLEAPSGIGAVVASGRPLVVADAYTSPDVRPELVERFGVGSALFMPVAWEGDVDCVAIAVSAALDRFDDGAAHTGMALARTAAGGLARLDLAASLERDPRDRAARARASPPTA